MGSCFSRAVGITFVLASMSRAQLPQIRRILTKIFSNYVHLMCYPGMPSVPTSVFVRFKFKYVLLASLFSSNILSSFSCEQIVQGREVALSRGTVRLVSVLHLLYFGDSPYTSVGGQCHFPVDCQHLARVWKIEQKCPATPSVRGAPDFAPRFPHHQIMPFLPFPAILYFALTRLQYKSNCHW